MSRRLRTVGRAVLLGVAIVGVLGLWVSMRRLPAWQAGAVPQVRGVFHVHSDSSHDGRIPATDLLKAADEIGLDFVMFTEHDRQPIHPSFPGGPLAIPGTELSTRYGHLIYFGSDFIPEAGPVRRSVVLTDSLRARGAFTVPAHPGSPKRPWTGRIAGIGGLEIANTSTDARVKGGPRNLGILPALLAYPFNRKLGLAQLYRRDGDVLRRWDRLSDPAVVGVCGTDTHGWIDARMNFRTWQLVLDGTDDAAAPTPITAAGVVERVAAGRFACVSGLLGDVAPRLSFRVRTTAGSVQTGASQPGDSAAVLVVDGPLDASGSASASGRNGAFTIVLLRDGVEVARSDQATLRLAQPSPGTYRVEIRAEIPRLLAGSTQVPVAYSNRIRLTE